MDHANAVSYGLSNAINQQAQYHGLAQSGVGSIKQQTTEAPKTLSSAASRLEALHGRLAKAEEALSMISSQIGALTPVLGGPESASTTPSGAVYRLNDLADGAHDRTSSIENLIAGIQRALG